MTERLVKREYSFGTSIYFEENQVRRKIVVLDGMWRPQVDLTIDDQVVNPTNIERYGFISKNPANCSYGNCSSITDSQIDNLPIVYDQFTGLENTNRFAKSPDNPIRQWFDLVEDQLSIKDVHIPNIQTLIRIMCEADKIDALDPNGSQYPKSTLKYKLSQGVWSSTCFRDQMFWAIYDDGFVFCENAGDSIHIVPVIELPVD